MGRRRRATTGRQRQTRYAINCRWVKKRQREESCELARKNTVAVAEANVVVSTIDNIIETNAASWPIAMDHKPENVEIVMTKAGYKPDKCVEVAFIKEMLQPQSMQTLECKNGDLQSSPAEELALVLTADLVKDRSTYPSSQLPFKRGTNLRAKELDAKELESVKSIYDSSLPGKEIMMRKYKVDLTRDVLRCCMNGAWITDEIVNFFCANLRQRSLLLCGLAKAIDVDAEPLHLLSLPIDLSSFESQNSVPNQPSTNFWEQKPCFFHKSLFYSKLTESGYKYNSVKKWTSKVDLFAQSRVFFPINCGNTHWCMAYADMDRKEVVYLDSLGGKGTSALIVLFRYLHDEYANKNNGAYLPCANYWKLLSPGTKGVPQQSNSYDCGIFTCQFANYLSIGEDISNLSQNDMEFWRSRILADILQGSTQ